MICINNFFFVVVVFVSGCHRVRARISFLLCYFLSHNLCVNVITFEFAASIEMQDRKQHENKTFERTKKQLNN